MLSRGWLTTSLVSTHLSLDGSRARGYTVARQAGNARRLLDVALEGDSLSRWAATTYDHVTLGQEGIRAKAPRHTSRLTEQAATCTSASALRVLRDVRLGLCSPVSVPRMSSV